MFAGFNGQAEAIERETAIAFDEDVFKFEERWLLRWGQKERVASEETGISVPSFFAGAS